MSSNPKKWFILNKTSLFVLNIHPDIVLHDWNQQKDRKNLKQILVEMLIEVFHLVMSESKNHKNQQNPNQFFSSQTKFPWIISNNSSLFSFKYILISSAFLNNGEKCFVDSNQI